MGLKKLVILILVATLSPSVRCSTDSEEDCENTNFVEKDIKLYFVTVDADGYLIINSQLWLRGNNQQITVHSNFKTTTKISAVAKGIVTQCFKMTKSGISRQVNAKELFHFNYIRNINVNLDSDAVAGSITFNATCIQQLEENYQDMLSRNQILECLHILRWHPRILGDNDIPSNYLDELDLTLTKYLMTYWLNVCNGSVASVTVVLEDFDTREVSVDKFPSLENFSTILDFQKLAKYEIEELSFVNNKFEVIQNEVFPEMNSLKILELRNCQVKMIVDHAFDSLPNLTHLNLAENNLRTLPDAVTSLSKLKVLQMYDNNYGPYPFPLHPPDFTRMTALEFLDLSGPHMWRLPTIFTNPSYTSQKVATNPLKHLKVLNLSSTNVEIFFFDLVNSIPNVETLILPNISLTANDAMIMLTKNWTKLHTLDLSDNRLEWTTHFTLQQFFNNLPNLKILNLANNNISYFSLLTLESEIDTSRFINLRNNSIRSWNEAKLTLNHLDSSLQIDFTNNNLTDIHKEMTTDFSKLERVKLAGNNFVCDTCNFMMFQQWLARNQTPNDLHESQYRCVFPVENIGELIADIELDPELCVFNWLLKIVVPILILTVTGVLLGALVHHYRWHLRYFWFLLRSKLANRKRTSDGPLHHYDAFVSYCSKDDDWVIRYLIPAVEHQEPALHLCIHERDFALGDTIINNVIDCIDNSRKCIFIISKQFIRSQWCQWELQMAQHKLFEEKNDVLVLIMLEELTDADIPRVLKRLMSTRTYLIWPQPDNVPACKLFWSRLKQCVGQCHCSQNEMNKQNEESRV